MQREARYTYLRSHDQETTQIHMEDHMESHGKTVDYLVLRAYSHKGDHAYISLKGYDQIKGKQAVTQDGVRSHMRTYREAHGFIGE